MINYFFKLSSKITIEFLSFFVKIFINHLIKFVKMKVAEIPREIRYAVLKDRQDGFSYRQIGARHNISHMSAKNICDHHSQYDTLDSLPRSGRPQISTDRDKRALFTLVKKNRRFSSTQLSNSWNLSSGKKASPRTVRRILQQEGFLWTFACKKPRLNKKSKKTRLEFCKKHSHWRQTDWQKVFFSDEMNIEVDNRKNRVQLRRKPSEKYNDDCLQETRRQGSGSIGIWACLTYQGLFFYKLFDGRLDAELYIDILGNCLLPTIDSFASDESIIFQQDNAPCHRARSVKEWFRENNVEVLTWPPYSPDLNCIENLWSWLDKQLAKLEIQNLEQLKAEVVTILDSVPLELCQRLINSMPNRINNCKKNKGGSTRY